MLDSIDNTRAERLANICFILCFHNPLRDWESQTGQAGRDQLAWFSRAGARTLESFESYTTLHSCCPCVTSMGDVIDYAK